MLNFTGSSFDDADATEVTKLGRKDAIQLASDLINIIRTYE
jgi:hypothetical protein